MHPSILKHRTEIAELCQRFGVVQLDLFGSAATGEGFDEAMSDFDFFVEFGAAAKTKAFDNYFGLLDGLERLFDRRIDLVTANEVRNPYLRASIDANREKVFSFSGPEAVV